MQNFSLKGSDSPKYGFQRSENTRVEVSIYPHSDDPIIFAGKKSFGSISLKGNRPTDLEDSLVSVSTTKVLNEASGFFDLAIKPSKVNDSLFNRIMDDDWVDIVFYLNTNPYHIFRGLIDSINEKTTVSNGATVTNIIVTGRCFGKIWENTPVWFSPYYNDIITKSLTSRVFNGIPEFFGTPDKIVLAYLKGFLEELENTIGINWIPPNSMPGIIRNSFLNNINFNENVLGNAKYFQNIPNRKNYNANAIMPEGTLWDLAKNYSDSSFTEMYTDFLPNGNPFNKNLGNSSELGSPDMSVIFRDKPFPILPSSAPLGYQNTWDKLPVFTIHPQEITSKDVSRGGFERYNAFFVASDLFQEEKNHMLSLISPLMDQDSVKRHGFRRLDTQLNMVPSEDNSIEAGGLFTDKFCEYQRQILRDWYCLNPYMLSGTIILGHGRPDIRIGCKLNVKTLPRNSKDISIDENYYIESVNNLWTFGIGTRTTIGVTRGWVGGTDLYNSALARVVSKYKAIPL